jgi:hypothetical protein
MTMRRRTRWWSCRRHRHPPADRIEEAEEDAEVAEDAAVVGDRAARGTNHPTCWSTSPSCSLANNNDDDLVNQSRNHPEKTFKKT